ncbi:MAG TPA: cyclic nucleotide-binding domain-containing protein [Candidatus Limnocylindrales bacterium]|nr:cyclic nucleotide-binding domain-containing protein [Candidatus Limnocylindrales bacterium]
MSTTEDVLRQVPLFRGMSDRTIASVGGIAHPGSFAAGEVIVREGDVGDSFIVITAGTAAVTQGGRPLRTLGDGDFLGEIALIDGGPRTATVTATTDIEALVIDRDGFGRLMSEFPVIRLDLVTALTQRLRERAPDPTD